MSELGEQINKILLKNTKSAQHPYLWVSVLEVTFKSGIELYTADGSNKNVLAPPAGTPHWGGGETYPAAYVREGGTGATDALEVKVSWSQFGRDGAAKLRGKSATGDVEIEGDFQISGARGEAVVPCKLTKRPATVKNYGGPTSGGLARAPATPGVTMDWKVEASGVAPNANGGSPLYLYFLDSKPKPVGWPAFGDPAGGPPVTYAKHYVSVVDWATHWADGKQGEAAVREGIWAAFSDGVGARVPHETGLSYWKTGDPDQRIYLLVKQGSQSAAKGWSCTAIAHLFMEALAVNGIGCTETIIAIPLPQPGIPAPKAFLVKNWDKQVPGYENWKAHPEWYYGGTWKESDVPPLNEAVPTTLKQDHFTHLRQRPLRIDMRKVPGVPGQGQAQAPLVFRNHWIVLTDGKLRDTSYGAVCPQDDLGVYASLGLAGWLHHMVDDPPPPAGALAAGVQLMPAAWVCIELGPPYQLRRIPGAGN